jgi:NAD(P)-dependent dehydrogenase (short-subunit alcohol dehydrogenase family)
MARVFITGSSTGLGLMAAQLLLELGHRVVVHGRNPERADATLASVPGADGAVVGDLSSIRGMRSVADQVNALGRFDAVIHNAGIGYRESRRVETEDGLPQLFATNTLAPYVLTALIHKPKRLVYLSSGMHRGANLHLDDLTWVKRPWRGADAYAETKLHDVLIAFGVARRWPDVLCNALEPGWVATRMGGPGASDDLDAGHRTQVWLAVSEDPAAMVRARYFYHLQPRNPNPASQREELQDQLLEACYHLSGIVLPG